MAYKAVLIDDNKNTVLSLEYSLEWENLGIELAGTAYDGRSGKELIEKTDPDIIISDINMPYLDGFTMVEESGKAEDRIIIVITGYDKFQYASRAIKLAVFDYILKPIDDEELNDSLKRAVRKLDKKHSLENQKINTVKAMMTVAITNHRDDTVGNITESEKEPVKRGLVMIGALKGEPSKALLERVETLTLLSSGNAYSIVTEERIILLVTEKRENSGWQAEIEKLKEKLTTLEELSALGISSEKEETASFYSLYLEAYEDLLKKSKKENHMQVSDLQENALRLADSIKGMEDYERIIEEFLMCTSGSYVAIQIMALFFCGRIMEEHKTWRGELDHLSFEVAGITSQKMFASWLKTFLAKIDEIREKSSGKSELVLLAVRYIKNHCLESLRLETVAEELAVRYPNTLLLAATSTIVAIIGGVGIGLLSAVKRFSIWDNLCMFLALIGLSTPAFYLGLMLMLVVCVKLQWLPITPQSTALSLILPTVTLSSRSLATIARMTRSSTLEILGQDYIQTARAQGFSKRKVIFGCALKNAMNAIVTVAGLQFGLLIGGAVITEKVFGWPGLGDLIVTSIKARDFQVVQSAILVIAASFVVVNLIVDLLYAVINPRIKLS